MDASPAAPRVPRRVVAGVAAVGLETWIERKAERPWSRAADCEALHRLWIGAAGCGLVRVSSTKAVATPELPQDAEDWVWMGLRAVVGLMQHALGTPLAPIAA